MNKNIGIIIQARTGSKRLPGKVLMNITNKLNMIEYLIKRIQNCKEVKKIIIATSNLKRDDKITKVKSKGIKFKTKSDDFFIKNKEDFDIIYVDGLHTYNQVKKDLINALKALKSDGIIIGSNRPHSTNNKGREFFAEVILKNNLIKKVN